MGVDVNETRNPDGTRNLYITCQECGGTITHSDEYGMWCDKECGREESMQIAPIMDEFIDELCDDDDPLAALARIDEFAARIEKAVKECPTTDSSKPKGSCRPKKSPKC
jgi:hypothetical protein